MEEVIVTAIVFGSLLGMLKLWLDYRRDKNQIKVSSKPSDSSLTTSELKTLLSEAVDEAVGRRFDRLEAQLDEQSRVRLMPASVSSPDEAELEHPAPPLVPRDRESTQ